MGLNGLRAHLVDIVDSSTSRRAAGSIAVKEFNNNAPCFTGHRNKVSDFAGTVIIKHVASSGLDEHLRNLVVDHQNLRGGIVPFRELMTDRVTLIKKDGRRFEDIPALASSSTIHTDDERMPIEEGDTFERVLPSGLTEVYVVEDRGFHMGIPGAIGAHYQTKVRKESAVRRAAGSAVFNLSGNNARVNINSIDQSENLVNTKPEALFQAIADAIERGVADTELRADILGRVRALEAARGAPIFLDRYQAFIASAAAHMTVISPFIPALTQLLK